MDDVIATRIETYRSRLQALIQHGVDIRNALDASPCNPMSLIEASRWQGDCGVTVNELSGGSKAHWLAREFSDAFLIRASGTGAVESVPPAEILQRLIGVLEQALASLSHEDAPRLLASGNDPSPHRFDFVHNPDLRPVLEQAYREGRRAYEQGNYDCVLLTYCGVLEAIVTDALEYAVVKGTQAAGMPEGSVAEWSFETRLKVAENNCLIGRGCVRLPDVALSYREMDRGTRARGNISERDARLTGQVLHVIMRDLNPGR